MRKSFLTIIFCLIISALHAQKAFSAEIKIIPAETTSNKLTVQVVGYGMMHITAERNAMEDLFKSVFFRGLPGSPTVKPLIGTKETEIMNTYKDYFYAFFEKRRYISFVNEKECTRLEGFGKRRKLKCILSIDIQALKEDLKSSKIISDYGY